MSRDTSERKRQQQVQELAKEYETLLNNIEDALFFFLMFGHRVRTHHFDLND